MGESVCQNSLNCMRMICVLFVYINTNLKIQEKYFKTFLWPLLHATRWWPEFMDFFVYRHWSCLLCSCLKVWETEGHADSQDPSLGRLQEIPSLSPQCKPPGWVLCVCITWPFLSPDLECVWYIVSYHTSHRCHTWGTTLCLRLLSLFWVHLSAWHTRKIINHLHLWFCQEDRNIRSRE